MIIINNGKDTVIAITRAQVKSANLTRVEYNKYKDLSANLQGQLKNQSDLIVTKDNMIASLTRQGVACDSARSIANLYISTLQLGLKAEAAAVARAEAKITIWKSIAGIFAALSIYLEVFK